MHQYFRTQNFAHCEAIHDYINYLAPEANKAELKESVIANNDYWCQYVLGTPIHEECFQQVIDLVQLGRPRPIP